MPQSTFLRQTALALLSVVAATAQAEQLGEVDTAFKLIGPDPKIVVEAYDDPKVAGVTCFLSRATSGGVTGALGLAEDKADASIACRQVGELGAKEALPRQEEVFSAKQSILFKRLRIVRIVDPSRKALLYLTYSDRLFDGSPKNSITAVPFGSAPIRTR